jgi:hypothetical protein
MAATWLQQVNTLRGCLPALAEEIAAFRGLSDLLDWFQRTGRSHSPVDIIGLDEFEYDFLIQRVPDGDWLVFGIT